MRIEEGKGDINQGLLAPAESSKMATRRGKMTQRLRAAKMKKVADDTNPNRVANLNNVIFPSINIKFTLIVCNCLKSIV